MGYWGANVRAGTCLARLVRAFHVLSLALASFATAAGAQTVRGVVVDRGDKPVSGVVVQLVDSSAAVVARALSTEQGEFRLGAPHTGTYRLHTLRIGYRPTTGEPFVVAAGEESSRRIVLAGVALALDTVRVSDRSSCRLNADTAAAIFAMWEQVRSALTAAQLTSKANAIDATVVSYERVLDAGTRRVMQQGSTVTTGLVTQPWAAPCRRKSCAAAAMSSATAWTRPRSSRPASTRCSTSRS